ncbi:restriction endonuclease subunit S [Hymenobacter lapidiphilus]|uniref:restriction endonuclease subunit S n=1 Tax=Hymenobacter sp. CCM 8763 TaxID=2303334 RepID=UPI000E34F2F5|nr:restriction endonuclease subunit S [Hymenobacter sp. CCM 8763]RFP67081.1 restriction endonuclease subunit S [Hymenobacter sp. CCM 8763]
MMNYRHVTLGEVADINPKVDWKTVNQYPSVSFVPMAAVSDTDFCLTTEKERPLEEVRKGFTYFQRGDVLLAKITPCFENGKVALAHIHHEHGFGSTEFHVIRAKEKIVHPQFLYYLLRQPAFIAEGTKNMTGSGGQKRVPKLFLENLPFTLPTLDTQHQIVATLEKADALRRKGQELLQKYDELAQSIFHEMFGDPAVNDRNWPGCSIRDVATKVTDGEHGTVKRLEDGWMYLMARNIRDSFLDLSDMSFISESDHRRIYKRCNPEEGDLLLVCVGATIGRVSLVPKMGEFSLARSVALIKPIREKVLPQFLHHLFKTDYMQSQIRNGSSSSAQAGIYTGTISELRIVVPPMDLQQQFERAMVRCAHMKETAKKSVEYSHHLFESTLDMAFPS